MIQLTRQTIGTAAIVFTLSITRPAHAGSWTPPVEVRHELKRSISYRARLSGEFLVVQARLDPGWHTFAMDNKQRAKEKLAGKPSLGIDLSTEITASHGLEIAGPWFQSRPNDFSKPELRWFSWGFEQQALFVAKARRSGPGPAQIAIRGQACSDTTCKNIDVSISLPLVSPSDQETNTSDIDFKTLVQVR
jgi:hypothetical protein